MSLQDANRAIALDPESAFAHDSRANVYRWENKYDLAILDHQRAIEIEPDKAEWYRSRADTYVSKGESELAIADYNYAIELDPENAKCYDSRASFYLHQNDFEHAIFDCDTAIKIDPQASFLQTRAQAYMGQKKYREALADYTHVIEQGDSFGWFHEKRGDIYAEFGDYDNAIHDYSIAIALYPIDYKEHLYFRLAVVFLRKDDYENALLALESAGHDSRRSVSIELALLGYQDLGNGRIEEALANFSRAVTADPQNASAYDNRGRIYLKYGNEEKAFEDFVVAASIDPKALDTSILYRYWEQGQEYEKKGDYASAITAYTRDLALRPDPHSYSVYAIRAELHKKTGNLDEAISDLVKAVELAPDREYYLSRLADTYLEKGDYENAFKTHIKQIELDPGKREGIVLKWRSRGNEHDNNQERVRAITCYDNLLALDPNDDHIYFMRGASYYFIDNFAKAVEDLTKAITLNPRYELYYRFRADAYDYLGDTARAKADRATATELR
ncbi:MAG: hypothetical protein KatS3mg050_0700 [Litorilinea sp.]|nr:MAG: hypothetical protein KatS3mg050_0700 [Litorilinea sp.]